MQKSSLTRLSCLPLQQTSATKLATSLSLRYKVSNGLAKVLISYQTSALIDYKAKLYFYTVVYISKKVGKVLNNMEVVLNNTPAGIIALFY